MKVLSRALRRGGFSAQQTRPCPFLRSLPLEACDPLFFLEAVQARQLDLNHGLAAAEREACEAAGAAARWRGGLARALSCAREGRHAPQVELGLGLGLRLGLGLG